ncbi:MAG TPA: SPFH domain-containing protein [Candidatus Dormibacteraeota bacterium]|jgi:membrane protease subunit (stomatin/prohibitin family)|nr:SPFH domain-containing protein [Candidatus Dormibacteraeota bacterium]
MALFRRENIAVPDDKKGQMVYKWPDVNIRRYTRAIVAPDEIAVFMYQGKVIGTLPPGRHMVDATELPFLGIFKDMLTGGNAYRTELYFVSTREFTDLRFGGRIDDVQDPQTGLVVALRVFGEYSAKVTDGSKLITNLTGTVNVTDNSSITDWMAEQLLKVLRTDVTANVVRNGWPILGLAAYVPQVEQSTLDGSNKQLETYGLTVARMGNFTVSLSDEDEATLKGLAKDTAYSRLAGGFQQYAAGELQLGAGQGMAKGGAGTGGAFVAAGLGLGQTAVTQQGQSPPPPPAPGFAGGGPGYAQPPGGGGAGAPATVACPQCGTASPAGSKFCPQCGTSLAPASVHCPQCSTEVDPGAKFCPNCGHNMAADTGGGPAGGASGAPGGETPPPPTPGQ